MIDFFRKLFGQKKKEDEYIYISRGIREVHQKGKAHLKFKYYLKYLNPNSNNYKCKVFNEREIWGFNDSKFPNRANGEKGLSMEIR